MIFDFGQLVLEFPVPGIVFRIGGRIGRVNIRTRTPLIATAVAASLMLGLALYGRLAGLATATSALMLTIFALVNLSLWRLKGRESAPPDVLTFPRWVPGLGCLLSIGFVLRELFALLA